MYTNKTTILYRNKRLDLTTFGREKLKNLRTAIYLDLSDVENQIGWAKSDYEENGTQYDREWMDGAVTAARIKHADIAKIDVLLESLPYTLGNKEQDIIELKRCIRKYLDGTVGYRIVEARLAQLDEIYGE